MYVITYNNFMVIIKSWLCGNNLNLLLNLNLIYKTLDWGKKWLVNFSAGKTQLVLFAWSNKMDGSVLEKKIIF